MSGLDKAELDKYITKEPDDSYLDFWEGLFDEFTDEFFQNNEDWLIDEKSQCEKWASKLHMFSRKPKQAAQIIERAHRRYIQYK